MNGKDNSILKHQLVGTSIPAASNEVTMGEIMFWSKHLRIPPYDFFTLNDKEIKQKVLFILHRPRAREAEKSVEKLLDIDKKNSKELDWADMTWDEIKKQLCADRSNVRMRGGSFPLNPVLWQIINNTAGKIDTHIQSMKDEFKCACENVRIAASTKCPERCPAGANLDDVLRSRSISYPMYDHDEEARNTVRSNKILSPTSKTSNVKFAEVAGNIPRTTPKGEATLIKLSSPVGCRPPTSPSSNQLVESEYGQASMPISVNITCTHPSIAIISQDTDYQDDESYQDGALCEDDILYQDDINSDVNISLVSKKNLPNVRLSAGQSITSSDLAVQNANNSLNAQTGSNLPKRSYKAPLEAQKQLRIQVSTSRRTSPTHTSAILNYEDPTANAAKLSKDSRNIPTRSLDYKEQTSALPVHYASCSTRSSRNQSPTLSANNTPTKLKITQNNSTLNCSPIRASVERAYEHKSAVIYAAKTANSSRNSSPTSTSADKTTTLTNSNSAKPMNYLRKNSISSSTKSSDVTRSPNVVRHNSPTHSTVAENLETPADLSVTMSGRSSRTPVKPAIVSRREALSSDIMDLVSAKVGPQHVDTAIKHSNQGSPLPTSVELDRPFLTNLAVRSTAGANYPHLESGMTTVTKTQILSKSTKVAINHAVAPATTNKNPLGDASVKTSTALRKLSPMRNTAGANYAAPNTSAPNHRSAGANFATAAAHSRQVNALRTSPNASSTRRSLDLATVGRKRILAARNCAGANYTATPAKTTGPLRKFTSAPAAITVAQPRPSANANCPTPYADVPTFAQAAARTTVAARIKSPPSRPSAGANRLTSGPKQQTVSSFVTPRKTYACATKRFPPTSMARTSASSTRKSSVSPISKCTQEEMGTDEVEDLGVPEDCEEDNIEDGDIPYYDIDENQENDEEYYDTDMEECDLEAENCAESYETDVEECDEYEEVDQNEDELECECEYTDECKTPQNVSHKKYERYSEDASTLEPMADSNMYDTDLSLDLQDMADDSNQVRLSCDETRNSLNYSKVPRNSRKVRNSYDMGNSIDYSNVPRNSRKVRNSYDMGNSIDYSNVPRNSYEARNSNDMGKSIYYLNVPRNSYVSRNSCDEARKSLDSNIARKSYIVRDSMDEGRNSLDSNVPKNSYVARNSCGEGRNSLDSNASRNSYGVRNSNDMGKSIDYSNLPRSSYKGRNSCDEARSSLDSNVTRNSYEMGNSIDYSNMAENSYEFENTCYKAGNSINYSNMPRNSRKVRNSYDTGNSIDYSNVPRNSYEARNSNDMGNSIDYSNMAENTYELENTCYKTGNSINYSNMPEDPNEMGNSYDADGSLACVRSCAGNSEDSCSKSVIDEFEGTPYSYADFSIETTMEGVEELMTDVSLNKTTGTIETVVVSKFRPHRAKFLKT